MRFERSRLSATYAGRGERHFLILSDGDWQRVAVAGSHIACYPEVLEEALRRGHGCRRGAEALLGGVSRQRCRPMHGPRLAPLHESILVAAFTSVYGQSSSADGLLRNVAATARRHGRAVEVDALSAAPGGGIPIVGRRSYCGFRLDIICDERREIGRQAPSD